MEQEPEKQVLHNPSRSMSRSPTSGTESDRSRSKSRRGTKRRKRSSERNEERKSTKRSNRWRCPCRVDVPDKINLFCSKCGRVDHGVCYGVYTNKIGFAHICGECANRFNFESTSAEMKDFYKKEWKSREGCKKMAWNLIEKRVIFAYADGEYKNYLGIPDLYESFLSMKFGIHESRSSTVLANLVYKRYIPGKDFKFGVNISKIKSVFGYVSNSSKSHGTKLEQGVKGSIPNQRLLPTIQKMTK